VFVGDETTHIEVAGHVPADSLFDQQLTLLLDEDEVGVQAVAGNFRIVFSVDLLRGQSAHLTLSSAKAFSPGDAMQSDDQRSLSFLLHQISGG